MTDNYRYAGFYRYESSGECAYCGENHLGALANITFNWSYKIGSRTGPHHEGKENSQDEDCTCTYHEAVADDPTTTDVNEAKAAYYTHEGCKYYY